MSLSGTTSTYTPNSGFSGDDTFTYITNDGTENSNTATVTITVNQTLGIEEHTNFKVYPNPVQDILNIDVDRFIKEVQIYSLNGKLVRKIINLPHNSLQVKELQAGTYILKIIEEDKRISIIKFIKK